MAGSRVTLTAPASPPCKCPNEPWQECKKLHGRIGWLSACAIPASQPAFAFARKVQAVCPSAGPIGRMVEGISKNRFWAKSLILVVKDDAHDGLDHVDGHRTVALAIGPSSAAT